MQLSRLLAFQRRSRGAVGREGFAAVDALVALMILSATIILSLGAAQVARRATGEAVQMRRADQALQGLLQTTPHGIGVVQGRAAGFLWWVTTTPSAGEARTGAVQVCARAAEVQALGDHRRYRMSTIELCPVPKTS